MKKKILLSIVVLMLMCFSLVGFVGCDSRNGAPTLTVKLGNVDAGNWGVYNTARMTNEDIGDKNGDGLIDSTDVVIYKNSLFTNNAAISITYTYKDKNGQEQKKEWTSYQSFINDGGNVNGFELDKPADVEYIMEFSYLTAKPVELKYKLTE